MCTRHLKMVGGVTMLQITAASYHGPKYKYKYKKIVYLHLGMNRKIKIDLSQC